MANPFASDGQEWMTMHLEGDKAETDADVIAASVDLPGRFGEIFRRHGSDLYQFLARRVGRSVAEDLLGEVFLAALRSRQRYDPAWASARPWLYGIATNILHRHRRSEARHLRHLAAGGSMVEPQPDETATVDARVDAAVAARRAAAALAELDPGYRDVVLLVAGPGLSYEQIAVSLGVPTGTVRSRLSRARRQLRELLGTSGEYLDVESTPPPSAEMDPPGDHGHG